MDPDQITLVRTSFARLSPQADAVARAFYDRLFRLGPELRSLFPADLGPQRAKLMQMLSLALGRLDDLPALLPAVSALGRRHAGYGVRPDHYTTVGRALLDTLADGLGADFTPAMAAAWGEVYAALAGAMQRGAATRTDALAA